jgi:hypothetical protein
MLLVGNDSFGPSNMPYFNKPVIVTECEDRSRRNPSHGTDWRGSDVRFWTLNASQAWTNLDHSHVETARIHYQTLIIRSLR